MHGSLAELTWPGAARSGPTGIPPAAFPLGQRENSETVRLSVVERGHMRGESLERLVEFWRKGLGLTGVHVSSHHLSGN